jgi:hypothetical protein
MWADYYQLVEVWRTAATDLGIRVTAPFSITDDDGDQVQFVAHVLDFGSARGTLVWTMPHALPARRLPRGAAFFISTLNPNLYREYDRLRFVGTLEAWGWSAHGAPPDWYNGV